MANRKLYLHYLGLAGAIALGAILRFWNLDSKPLWLDEVITAIFTLGKNYNAIPLDVVFPLREVRQIFTFQPGVNCPEIARNIATQSTHPPLFFCWMYSWLGWISPLGEDWVGKLRSLPALFGIAAIAVIYCVNLIAFSPTAGLAAAAVMAVSPFAVYLSQEARHYTLPMLLIAVALLGLIQIQQDIFQRQRLRLWIWLGWAIANIIGFYVHYFFILAFIAQIVTLLVLMYWHRNRVSVAIKRKIWLAIMSSTSVVALCFLPWLPVVLNDFNRPETDWLPTPHNIAPLYQTVVSWILMVIALPVEHQPLPITVISGLLMVLFAIWLGWHVFKRLRQLWIQSSTHLATLTLLSFTVGVLLQFLAIVYLLGKDITIVPRYNFVYYPSFCALLAASLLPGEKNEKRIRNLTFNLHSSFFIILLVSVISCIFVTYDLAFQKPFLPQQVAQNMNQEPSVPLMVVVAYRDYQDVALGLSFALALEEIRTEKSGQRESSHALQAGEPRAYTRSSDFAFFQQSPTFASVWQKLSQVSPTASQFNLWLVAPGVKRRDYPQQLRFSGQTACIIIPSQHYRIGIPYQMYKCE